MPRELTVEWYDEAIGADVRVRVALLPTGSLLIRGATIAGGPPDVLGYVLEYVVARLAKDARACRALRDRVEVEVEALVATLRTIRERKMVMDGDRLGWVVASTDAKGEAVESFVPAWTTPGDHKQP